MRSTCVTRVYFLLVLSSSFFVDNDLVHLCGHSHGLRWNLDFFHWRAPARGGLFSSSLLHPPSAMSRVTTGIFQARCDGRGKFQNLHGKFHSPESARSKLGIGPWFFILLVICFFLLSSNHLRRSRRRQRAVKAVTFT